MFKSVQSQKIVETSENYVKLELLTKLTKIAKNFKDHIFKNLRSEGQFSKERSERLKSYSQRVIVNLLP